MSLLAAFFLFAVSASAQDAQSLESLKSKLHDALSEIETKHSEALNTIKDQYEKYLSSLSAALQKKGDLEGVLSINRETERFKKDGTFPETAPEKIPIPDNILSQFKSLTEKADIDKLQDKIKLYDSYIKRLSDEKKNLVREAKIEEALAVNAELNSATEIFTGLNDELKKIMPEPAPKKPVPDEDKDNSGQQHATLYITCDNQYTVWLNGEEIGSDNDWQSLEEYPIEIKQGDILAIEASDLDNGDHTAGLFCCIVLKKSKRAWGTDESWSYTDKKPLGSRWQTARTSAFRSSLTPENVHPAHNEREKSYNIKELKGDFVWSNEPVSTIYIRETISFNNFSE